MKYLLPLLFVFTLLACKDKAHVKIKNIHTVSHVAAEQIPQTPKKDSFSEIDFLNIQGCCLDKKLDLPKNRFIYSYNNKVYDLFIVFYPFDENDLKQKNIDKTVDALITENTISRTFSIYTIFFPGKNLEPVYEGYDQPSYYDYTFPAIVKIYKLVAGRKWKLIKEQMMNEDAYYDIKNANLKKLVL